MTSVRVTSCEGRDKVRAADDSDAKLSLPVATQCYGVSSSSSTRPGNSASELAAPAAAAGRDRRVGRAGRLAAGGMLVARRPAGESGPTPRARPAASESVTISTRRSRAGGPAAVTVTFLVSQASGAGGAVGLGLRLGLHGGGESESMY